ncbi:MAG TPA: anaerobic ribonucleoside-triphosphate reductase [Kiritimatiellia bacterium]|nr:anaerobic ribonucleoside-triphosphate reductase [Kiritimatiellia bacterium]
MVTATEVAARQEGSVETATGLAVRKRDGRVVPFDAERIRRAIAAAFRAQTGLAVDEVLPEETTGEIRRITGLVVAEILDEAGRKGRPDIEAIQDQVERQLMEAGHHAVAKCYILYREGRRRERMARDAGEPLVPAVSSVDEYIAAADWRVSANANQGYSLGGLILNVSGKVTANYWLHHVYGGEIEKAHREGDLHIHDLDLTAREFDVLALLAQWRGQPVSRDLLAREVWKVNRRLTPLDNVIDVHLSHLRDKLDQDQPAKLIQTVRGVGFRLAEENP